MHTSFRFILSNTVMSEDLSVLRFLHDCENENELWGLTSLVFVTCVPEISVLVTHFCKVPFGSLMLVTCVP